MSLRDGDLLTVGQVLRIVPLSKTTVYALVESGQLPSYRVKTAGSRRGHVLIARRDLEAFVEKCRDSRTCAPTRANVDTILSDMRDRKRGTG